MSTAALARAEGGASAPEIDGSEGARSPDAPASTSHLSTTAVAVPVPVASAPDAAAVLDADCAWTGEVEATAGAMGTTATPRGCVCGGLTSTHILCVCLLCVLLAAAIPLGVVFGKSSDEAAAAAPPLPPPTASLPDNGAEPPLPQLPPPTASLPDSDVTECSLADFSGDVTAYGMSADGGGNPFCYRVSLGPSGEFDHGYDAPSCEDYSPRLTIGYYSKLEDSVMHYDGGSKLYACDWYGGRSGTVQLVIDDSIDARATASAGETAPCRYDLTITSPSCEAVVRDLGLSWEKSLPQPPPPPEEDAPTASLPDNDECIYELSPNESEFVIDTVYLNGQQATEALVNAIPGDTLRVTGKAKTCSSSFCPGCVTQLYVSLMADDGSLYDPCTYMWAGQVVGFDFTGAEGEPFLVRPSLAMTSKCFDYRSNSDCGYATFDEEFVVNDSGRYALVLSLTYQYQCQQLLEENELKILGVVDDDFTLEIGDGAGGMDVQPPSTGNGASFGISANRVSDKSDHASTCKDEFGSEWGVADWDYDLKALGVEALLQLMAELGIEPINSDLSIGEPRWYDGYFVTRSGLKWWQESSYQRVYNFHFIVGGAPSWFLVHETLAEDIYLGSWFDMERYVLCKSMKN